MSRWPVPVTAPSGGDAGVVLWRKSGTLYVTAIVKARFLLRHDAVAEPMAPEPLRTEDVTRKAGAEPSAVPPSLERAHELAPYRPEADVTLIGHAHALGKRAAPLGAVRFALFRGDTTLFDRNVRVFGDREGSGAPQPFSTMPLVYERAVGGGDHPENPHGLDPKGERRPNLVDPSGGARAGAFGPIAPSAPSRRDVLSPGALTWSGRILELSDALPWAYFQAAPASQRCSFLRGDETIVLEGVHPDLAAVRTRLPGCAAEAWLVRGGAPPVAIALVADTLAIDADTLTCELVWRGHCALAGPAELGSIALRCALGAAQPGGVVAAPGPPASRRFDETAPLAAGAGSAAATPFAATSQRGPQIRVSVGGVPVTPAPHAAPNPALPSSFRGGAPTEGRLPPSTNLNETLVQRSPQAVPSFEPPFVARRAASSVPVMSTPPALGFDSAAPPSAPASVAAPAPQSGAHDPRGTTMAARLRAAGAGPAEIDNILSALRFVATRERR